MRTLFVFGSQASLQKFLHIVQAATTTGQLIMVLVAAFDDEDKAITDALQKLRDLHKTSVVTDEKMKRVSVNPKILEEKTTIEEVLNHILN